MTLSQVLKAHLEQVARMRPNVQGGQLLASEVNRTAAETELVTVMAEGGSEIQSRCSELGRSRPIRVATGTPKGAWAHIYYVSFHDPLNSSGPMEGFYPVFLLSADGKTVWLVVMLAAASVGITGRGGWSKAKGDQLATRASFLYSSLRGVRGWVPGPIPLGAAGVPMRSLPAGKACTSKAYECGVIAAKEFNASDLPGNLASELAAAWGLFDQLYHAESRYLRSALVQASERECLEQASAILTGRAAEAVALGWLAQHRANWGPLQSCVDRVGLGYDIAFPKCGIYVEVKGCQGDLDAIRITPREWEAAQKHGDRYFLCLVTQLSGRPVVRMIQNPFQKLREAVETYVRIQVTHVVLGRHLAIAMGSSQEST